MKEKVIEVLKSSSNPLKSADIAKKLGVATSDVTKIIKELKKENLIYSPKRCFYACVQD
ncbi:MarR family protein [Desulfonauticus submarinus]|uniref:MarR family protein n=1 Tax=Desulfonauticus submarinus TaxID=206665 RepID=A0A1H0F9V1_9BACT|nr:MarR family transcriptional regulator [Desulfonauticus submarinus]SDN91322.1 MarR family protein [Desulfonauticus submarinus]